ncbi:DNA polymerase-like [Pecten maximus]|uniref:DNA polymerase-like n=1 Tax=Pecten maximus TaxID=6579 RepID=UPI001458D172|nr:DNA polymerase-like [Pecten maximus]
MPQSLETLTENLAKEGLVKFSNFSKAFTETEAKFLLRKGIYPYEYVDTADRFLEQKLPPKEKFYSSLSRSHVSDADYAHAQTVWEKMDIRDLGQYHDLYLKTDVLLLADVFENFRNMCLDYYGLDAAHFYTSPGLAWSAALKMTRVRLELIRDPDMYLFFENGVRGGVSMISNKYAQANNPYIPETYDLSQPHSYIMYTDCNNLYGKAMSEPLPIGGFRWVDNPQTFDITKVSKHGDLGYVLEVDLEYPDELHDSHSDYPPRTGTNLQLYLELGLKITKIHRILEFKQTPWLHPYIQFNTSKRASCKNEFEKDFFKLMNNAVFGKTMENVRSRVDIKLAHTEKKLKKYVARPSFKRFTIFNEDLVAIQNDKVKLVLNKPVYVGQTILDLSKCIMYEFYYKYLKPKYGHGIKLLMTDTDSLLYHVQCPDVYDDIYRDRHLFDLSNYPVEHHCHDTRNKKIPGYFKDETGSEPIAEFVGLRAKMYSYVYAVKNRTEIENLVVRWNEIKEKQVAKGVARATIRRDLRHEMYRDCLFDNRTIMTKMNSIRSDKHQLYVYTVNKSGLCAFDDKRWVLPNRYDTLSFGHYIISAMGWQ